MTGEMPRRRQPSLQPWQRNLYTIVFAETVAMIGFSIASPFLPFYLQDLGVSSLTEVAFWVGVISSLQPICMAVSAPFWGILSDRYGRKLMLTRAMIGGGIALALSGLAMSPLQLTVFRVTEGILAGTVAAATTLVVVTTPREQTGYGLGLLQTGMFTGNFVGPLIGGAIGGTLGYRFAFFTAAAMLATAGLLVTLIVKENFVRPVEPRQKGNPLLETARGVFRSPLVLTMILLLTLNNMSIGVTMPVLPLYVQTIVPDLKQASAATGVILGATALANAAAAIWVGRSADGWGRRRTLLLCVIAGGLSHLPQGVTQTVWQLLGLRVVTGFAMGGINPVANAVIAGAAGTGVQGGVYGVSASMNALGRAIGPMIGTAVVAGQGVHGVFPVTGAMLLVVAIFVGMRTASMDLQRRSE